MLFLFRWVLIEWALRPWFAEEKGFFGFSHFGAYMYMLFQFSFWMALLCHLRAMLSDAGRTPPLPTPENTKHEQRHCESCGQWKPHRTHHCSICNVCVHHLDHHCYWINNCVGYRNQKYFSLFLFYVVCCAGLGLGILFGCCAEYLRMPKPKGPTKHGALMVCTFSGMTIIIFLLYALESLRQQLICIEANQSQIDFDQGKFGSPVLSTQRSLMAGLRECFGKDWWLWWAPTSSGLQPDYKEEVYTVHDRIELQRAYMEKHKDSEDCPWVVAVGLLGVLTLLWLSLRSI